MGYGQHSRVGDNLQDEREHGYREPVKAAGYPVPCEEVKVGRAQRKQGVQAIITSNGAVVICWPTGETRFTIALADEYNRQAVVELIAESGGVWRCLTRLGLAARTRA